MSRLGCVLSLALGPLAAAGCGSGAPNAHTVSGRVTFGGAALPDGDIIFVPADNKAAPDAGKIKDGRYSLAVKEGKHQVQIRASKKMKLPPGEKGALGETELEQDYIPERYNLKTQLTADVFGPREGLNFDLKK